MNTKERAQKMKEAVEYLDSTPFFAKKSSPENVKRYLDLFGHPERGMKIIHVAGTNGKGSVCARIASCLREAGFRVGLFISPHLSVIRERMSINGEMISEEEFLGYFDTVKEACNRSGPDALPHLLYFEMLFMMAMLWFRDQKPDYLVLETGLGGRLDATNSVEEKAVTVITRIGIDHTAYLGDTISQIAGEKAGILRKGCPAVYLTEPQQACEVIRETAARVGAPAFELSREAWRINRADENGIDFLLDSRYDKNLRINISDRALYQCENTALAVTTCGILLRKIGRYDPEMIIRGVEKASWPGRMEEILPRVWIDGAHNPDGIRAFLESVKMITDTERQKGKVGRVFLLFSCVKDKSYREELGMISRSGLFTDIAAVPMEGSRALDAETLRACVSENMNQDSAGVRVHETASVRDAAETFIMRRDKDDLVFAAGSLYLIGEMRDLLTE